MKLNSSLFILVLFSLFCGLVSCNGNKTINNADIEKLDKSLNTYHSQLEQFREEFGGTYHLPNVSFFLFGTGNREKYPYLGWARDHFYSGKNGLISDRDYPLTWETEASQADYAGMRIISSEYVKQKIAAPHTWHAAEVFLYLYDIK